MVDLTSEDEHVKSEPKMKSRDAGMFNLDDPDTEKWGLPKQLGPVI